MFASNKFFKQSADRWEICCGNRMLLVVNSAFMRVLLLIVVSVGVCLYTVNTSQGQEGGKPGEGGAPAIKKPFCVVQVASIDRVEKASQYIAGFFQDRAALEKKYRKWLDEWNEPDGADRNRPLGLMVFLGETIQEEPWFVLSFPVTDPVVFLQGLGKDNPEATPPVKVPGQEGVWEIPEVISGITHAIEVGDSLLLCNAKVLEKPFRTFARFDDSAKEDARQFDFSASIRLSEVPPGIRNLIGVGIRAGMAQAAEELAKQSAESSNWPSPEVEKLFKSALRTFLNSYAGAFEKLCADGTDITLGMKIDPELELMEVSIPWHVTAESGASRMIDSWRVQDGRLIKLLDTNKPAELNSFAYTGFRAGKTLSPLGGIFAKMMEEAVRAQVKEVEAQRDLIKALKPLQDLTRTVFSGKSLENFSETQPTTATASDGQAAPEKTVFNGLAVTAFAPRKNLSADLTVLLPKLEEIRVNDAQLVQKVSLGVGSFQGLPIHQLDYLMPYQDPAKALEEIPGFPKVELEEKPAGDGAKAPEATLIQQKVYLWISDDLICYSTLSLELTKSRLAEIVEKIQAPADPLASRRKIPFYITSTNLKDLAETMLKPVLPADLPPVDPSVGALKASLRPLENGLVLSYQAEQAWIRLMAIGIEKGLLAAEIDDDAEAESK